jgi:hypothetical protein
MQGQHIPVVPSDKLKSTPLELLESIAFAKNPADVNIAAGVAISRRQRPLRLSTEPKDSRSRASGRLFCCR